MSSNEERFWSKVNIADPGECWLWRGGIFISGYGRFWANDKSLLAHRYSLSLYEDLLPGMHVMHSCDVPLCVNPEHLSQGTPADNAHDRDGKGRSRGGSNAGENSPVAKLTTALVLEIRRRSDQGEPRASLAVEFDVRPPTISNIANRKSWTHV